MKTIKTASIAIGLFLTLSACHPSQSQNRVTLNGNSAGIINGKPVQKEELPYKMTARILADQKGVWYPVCTASVLADDLILTAAHCVRGLVATDLRIGFDAQPLSYTGQQNSATRVDVLTKFVTNEVQSFIIHPMYEKSDYDQDMALVKIKGHIPSDFMPAPLMSEEQMKEISPKQNYQVVLVGFGLFKEAPSKDSNILRQTKVSAQFEDFHVVMDQTHGSGGCNGDSGGPAYLEIKGMLYLVGVTHGPKYENPDCHHQGIWGNPNFEKAFLNQSAKKLGSSARF